MVRKKAMCFGIALFLVLSGPFSLGFQNVLAEGQEYMSWGIQAMGLDQMIQAINQKSNPEHVLVAVIDTGVNLTAFNAYFPERDLSWYCVVECEGGMVDNVGHGTHIIGTIAEGTGSNVDLLAIRASSGSSYTITNLLNAIEYAVEQGADVINISAGNAFDFGNETYNSDYDMTWGEIYRQVWEIEKETIDEAIAAGAIIIGSAGNEGSNELNYPASYEGVISVGAVNSNNEIVNFSNYNEHVDFVAPGANIRGLSGTYTGEEGQSVTTYDQGTSTAAAHVSAAVADLLSFNKDLSKDDVMEVLKSRAIDLGDEGKDDYYGYGFIDFSDAEFCEDGGYCDNYRVFAAESPEMPDEPVMSDDEEALVPNAGRYGRVAGSTMEASLTFYILTIIGIIKIAIDKKHKLY